jgi:acetate kinase
MNNRKILVINCGSSSLKYQLYMMPEGINLVKGMVDRIGQKNTTLIQEDKDGKTIEKKITVKDHSEAFNELINVMTDKKNGILHGINEIDGVAHRVVHGGEKYSDSVIITNEVLNDIEKFSDLAPLHNPVNLDGIKAAMQFLPNVKHTATFDTSFHQTIPEYAYMYGLPYELYEKYKIRRYGFHGTSHKFVANKALEYCKRAKENTNLITCHLGNGCSITAIAFGKSVDTSMGFTPLEGLVMGTRSGDIDPAIIHYLADKGYTDKEIIDLLNKKSGVLGLSGISNDMRDIEKAASEGNKKAKLALDAFSYRIRKYIGAYSTVLVKVDILVFTGGIGQNSVLMRELICKNLENIGIILDKEKNRLVGSHIGIISVDHSPITIMVIPTNEEKGMADDCYKLLFR